MNYREPIKISNLEKAKLTSEYILEKFHAEKYAKASRYLDKYYNIVLKEIKKASAEGRTQLIYNGDVFGYFRGWNECLIKLLINKFKEEGFSAEERYTFSTLNIIYSAHCLYISWR